MGYSHEWLSAKIAKSSIWQLTLIPVSKTHVVQIRKTVFLVKVEQTVYEVFGGADGGSGGGSDGGRGPDLEVIEDDSKPSLNSGEKVLHFRRRHTYRKSQPFDHRLES